jgi:hypothetical protein
LAQIADDAAEAARLGCTHWLNNGQAVELGTG